MRRAANERGDRSTRTSQQNRDRRILRGAHRCEHSTGCTTQTEARIAYIRMRLDESHVDRARFVRIPVSARDEQRGNVSKADKINTRIRDAKLRSRCLAKKHALTHGMLYQSKTSNKQSLLVSKQLAAQQTLLQRSISSQAQAHAQQTPRIPDFEVDIRVPRLLVGEPGHPAFVDLTRCRHFAQHLLHERVLVPATSAA